jgi:hypothetical protein
MFKNLESIFYQIRTALLNSTDLKKLVFYDTPDALTRAEPTDEEVLPYIYIKPVIYVYEDSPEKDISSFISIGVIESQILEGSIESSIKVSIACNRATWELNNSRVRPLAILSEIEKQINEQKFGAAGKLELRIVKEIYYSNDLVGYAALFDILDEKGDIVNEF